MNKATRRRDLLIRYTAAQRGTVAVMAVLVLLGIGMALVEPNIVRLFIQSIEDGAQQRTLVLIALLFLAVAVLQQCMTALAVYFSEKVGWSATNMLRGDLLDQVLRLDRDFHESHPPGEVVERIDGDVNGINAFFANFVVDIVGNTLLLVGILVALTLVNPAIGLWFTLLAVAGMFLLIRVSRLGAPQWERNRDESGLFYGELGEILRATEDIRSLGAAPYAMSRFYRRIRAWLPIEVRAATIGTSIWISTILLFSAATILAYGLGGRLHRQGTLPFADLYLVVSYALMLIMPMEAIRNQLHFFQQAIASLHRVFKLLALRSTVVDGTRALPEGALSVQFRDVTFGYGTDHGDGARKVLSDFDLVVPAGHKVGLVGRTGSGKSTIAALLFRHYDPQQGAVLVGGHDLRTLQLQSLRGGIGMVTQEVHIFNASLRDNLTFFDPGITDERLETVLGTLGLTRWLRQLPDGMDSRISADSMSAGEAQLISFARVFLKEPGLLILDEPSSSLDSATELMINRAMEILLEGRTVLLIAHRLETLRAMDDVLVLEDGRITAQGDRTQILNSLSAQLTGVVTEEDR